MNYYVIRGENRQFAGGSYATDESTVWETEDFEAALRWADDCNRDWYENVRPRGGFEFEIDDPSSTVRLSVEFFVMSDADYDRRRAAFEEYYEPFGPAWQAEHGYA